MPDRARDMPMSPRERAAVAKVVAHNQKIIDRHRKVVAGLAAIKPRADRNGYIPQAEYTRTNNAKIAYGLRHQKELAAAKEHPATRDEARKVEAAAFGDFGKGKLNKLVGQTGEDLVNAGIYTPAGVYLAGKAGVQDVASTAKGKPTVKHTARFGKQVAKSTAETVKHPLRHPGDTLLLAGGALAAGAGAVTRAGAAGAAAKEASAAGKSAARAALTRPGYEGGSLLRKPVPELRHHKVGDLEVGGIYSAAPGVRHAEKAIARGRGKVEAKGSNVAETAGIRATGIALGQNRRVQEAAGRAHAAKLAHMGKKLTRPQQQALRVWGQRLTPDEKIDAYKRNIQEVHASELPDKTKLSMAKALADKIALTEAARPYFKEGTADLADTFTTPVKASRRKGANPNQLKAVAAQAERVAGNGPHGRTRALIDAGVLEPEQADFRVSAPGRLAKGAEWTTAAQEAVKRLDQIEKERAAVKGKPTVVPGKIVETSRPRTKEEASARLTALDEAVAPLVDQIASGLQAADKEFGKGGPKRAMSKEEWVRERHAKRSAEIDLPPEDQADWERANFGYAQGDVAFQKGGNAKRSPEHYRAHAEEILSQIAGNKPEFPIDPAERAAWARELQAQGIDPAKLRRAITERSDLRDRLTEKRNVEDVFGAEQAAPAATPDYGNVVSRTREPDKILPPELDEAGVQALADLDKREQQAFGMLDQGDEPFLVGAEEHQGRFRVPDVRVKGERRQLFAPRVFRGGNPRQPGSLRHGYTGALEATGRFRVNTTAETARSALEARQYTNALDLRDQVLKAGVRQRPEDTRFLQYVPVREKTLTAKQRRMLNETAPLVPSEGELETTAAEAARAEQWAQFLEDMFPEKEYANVPAGAEVPNVVWVPRQFFHDINAPFVRQNPGVAALASGFDTVMNLVKFGVIPLKTAYVTANAVGNFVFNALQQGVFLPRNWTNAVKMLRDPELGPIVREVMGSGGMRSLVDGNPKGLQVLNHGMHVYGHAMSELMAEPMMRVSALAHEAERFGFKGVDGMRRLFNDPGNVAHRDLIVRRANNAIVDYDRLGPIEKAVVRRVLFIYPWVKGATLYAGHFLAEHPVQSAVYSQMAEVGRQQAQKDLGPVPSWAEGTFKVGGSRDFPLTVNPSTISPLGQAADIAKVGMGLVSPKGGSAAQFGSLLHPGLQAAIEAAYKRDTFTGAPLQGSTLGLFGRRAVAQTAPATLAENLHKAGQPPGQRTFPMTEKQAILRNVVGSFMPRTANREALNESAVREATASLSPGQRARRKAFQERQSVYETMRANNPELLQNGELPAPVKQAYNREAAVDAARAEARHASHRDPLTYYRDVAVREARLLEQWGQVPKGFADTVGKVMATLNADDAKAGVAEMRRSLMPDAYQDMTREARKYVKEHGAG